MLVIKVGGAAGVNFDEVCNDLAGLAQSGHTFVVVHGGSDETNRMAERLGMPPRFITSPSGFTSRFTDRGTLEVFAMMTAGKVNTLFVEALQRRGVNALGLSGVDGRLLIARRKEAVRSVEDGKVRVLHGDHTGTITEVNAGLLDLLITAGYVPVVAPLALSPEGVALNVDADRAAAVIAAAVGAESLILLTNVPGLMRHFPDEATLIPHLDRGQLAEALECSAGRMKKKVLGAIEALDHGVRQVVLSDGRVEQPVRRALAGAGTVIG
jgi:[amino group carrier protein]-L-2-aminoadipate 6-kinase